MAHHKRNHQLADQRARIFSTNAVPISPANNRGRFWVSGLTGRAYYVDPTGGAVQLTTGYVFGGQGIPRPRQTGTFHALAALQASNFATGAVSAGVVRYIPFIATRTISIDRLGVNLTTFGAGTAQTGIYSNNYIGGNDVPSTLLASVTYSTAAAPSNAALPLFTFQPGVLYWLAHVQSVARNASLHTPQHLAPLGRQSATVQFTHRQATATTLAPVAPATTLAVGNVVAIFGREV